MQEKQQLKWNSHNIQRASALISLRTAEILNFQSITQILYSYVLQKLATKQTESTFKSYAIFFNC